ncbi:hypothetical protein [Pedobacter gandavensis]|uniref:hypothetical protein n=1 Tax=Pedobacter gandavensis TaxID=2679963 RepID=UPI003977DFC5
MHLVEAKRRNELEPKKDLISTRDICVSKNLYTIPNKDGDEKFALEKYSAKEIVAVYPEVSGWLVDPTLTKITHHHFNHPPGIKALLFQP